MGTPEFQTFVNKILEAASQLGMSQAELERKAGIVPETISRMKQRGDADFSVIFRLADVVDLRLSLEPKETEIPPYTPRNLLNLKEITYDEFDQ